MLSGSVTSSGSTRIRSDARQQAVARRPHGGDHGPALRVEVARGLEAVAGRAAGDQYGLHRRSPSVWSMAGVDSRRWSGLSAIDSPDFVCHSPEMVDPLSEVIALLRPRTVFSKGISGAGRWAVRYTEFGQPSFCTVIEGRCRLAVDGEEPP